MIMNNEIHQTWNASYILDIPIIDKQHAHFFELFDKLQVLNTERAYEELYKVIVELENYSNTHFNTEEALMRKSNASNYEYHIQQHEIFREKVEEFKIAYDYKNTMLLEQMINFMRKWFLVHISDTDRNYVEKVHTLLNNSIDTNI